LIDIVFGQDLFSKHCAEFPKFKFVQRSPPSAILSRYSYICILHWVIPTTAVSTNHKIYLCVFCVCLSSSLWSVCLQHVGFNCINFLFL